MKGITHESIVKAANTAIFESHYSILKYILDHENDLPNEIDELLVEAVYVGNSKIITLLIERGANVNADNGAPLRQALINESYQNALLLVKYGANVDNESTEMFESPYLPELEAILGERKKTSPRSPSEAIVASPAKQSAPKKTSSPQKTPSVSPAKMSSQKVIGSPKQPVPQQAVPQKTPPQSPRNASATSAKTPVPKKTPPQSPRKATTSPAKRSAEKVSPPQSPRATSTDRPRCAAITRSGTQCSFKAKERSKYCGIHQK